MEYFYEPLVCGIDAAAAPYALGNFTALHVGVKDSQHAVLPVLPPISSLPSGLVPRLLQGLTHPLFLIALPFILTHLVSTFAFSAAQSSKRAGRKAPLVPYTIPIVGHAMHFAISVGGLIQDNM